MNHFSTHRAAIGCVVRHAGVLCCVLIAMSGVARAQTSITPDTRSAPAESAARQDGMPPPGGCKPIGLTVSGEIVFPLECKEFIEQQKAMNRPAGPGANPALPEPKSAGSEPKPVAVDVKPALTDEKPAPANKPAAVEDKPSLVKQRPETADAKPAAAETKPAAAETKPAAAETNPAPSETKPAAAETKPAAAAELKPEEPKPVASRPAVPEEKTAAKPAEEPTPEDSQASQQVGSVPLPRRAERKPRERLASEPGCTHYRTYDAAAGTYRGFDGRIRPCR